MVGNLGWLPYNEGKSNKNILQSMHFITLFVFGGLNRCLEVVVGWMEMSESMLSSYMMGGTFRRGFFMLEWWPTPAASFGKLLFCLLQPLITLMHFK